MDKNIPAQKQIYQERAKWVNDILEHWYHEDFLSIRWWFLFGCTLIPYYIWWKLVERDRFFEIFTFGLVTTITSCIFDVVGVYLGLWDYPAQFIPLVPFFVPADITAIPVTSMLLYQYCKHWKSFTAASMALSAVFAYVFEPLFIKLDIFEIYKWKHTYGFAGFFVMFNINRLFIYFLKKYALNK
ncbi:CBO0543 family protein [Peribacillus deserti]|uniref:Uncharacterized protein n=1 Tax=Peribacillus deserti TaxID=673318 RepID=A0A2N5M4Z5_9BACI|nr:CBO0543 family protein [Peribacillus deserti]PLT29434.1 hypothetical protein CUU66_13095 [Peribacillus deserti]